VCATFEKPIHEVTLAANEEQQYRKQQQQQ
jgi:hypothetical protein